MKFLIIRLSSIGDLVLTTPVIRALKDKYPGCIIHYCTKQQFSTVLEEHPLIDKLITYKGSLPQLIQELKPEKYDLVIDLHNNLRTRLIKLALGRPSRAFNKLNIEKYLMVRFKQNRLPKVHIVDRYLEAAGINNASNKYPLEFFIKPDNEVDTVSTFGLAPETFACLVIGAQHQTKKLTVEKCVELINAETLPVLIIGAEKDNAEALQIIAQVIGKQVINTCGKFNLQQSASLVKQAAKIYANDTGLMHIAAAFKRKMVVFWGNTIPEFGMYPYLTEHYNAEVKDLGCRPCSKIGFNTCPKEHFNCMNKQDVVKAVSF